MKESGGGNVSASVRARLLNLARASGRDFQELVFRYAVERFLARLNRAGYRNRFILKGAMLYVAWKLDDKRTTMDLDLLGHGNPDPQRLVRVFGEACEIELNEDGLVFESQSLQAAPIREDSIYDGVRVIVRARLGVMKIRLQVDVGFGDAVVPDPRPLEFPPLLAARGPVIRTYRPETVISEKLHAMVALGMANSRMKDYYDIWMLARAFAFEGLVLKEAILETFAARQTPLPGGEPLGLSDEFAGNALKLGQWKGFLGKRKARERPPDLPDIVAVIRGFLLPVLRAISVGTPVPKTWTPSTGWRGRAP